MQTFPKPEIERVAAKVAAMLLEHADPAFGGDVHNPYTWADCVRGICPLVIYEDCEGENGRFLGEYGTDDELFWANRVEVFGSFKRPGPLSQVLVHELAHAYLTHYAPSVWVDDLWTQYDYCYQARENICRAVERTIFGADAVRGWLPAHGFYWN